MAVLGSASLRLAVAAWLLLTNLSLGQYHRHDAAEAPAPADRPHRAAPQAWHYHVLLLGVEFDFLSLNSETCPFAPEDTRDGETHVLLATLFAPGSHDESTPFAALLLAFLPAYLSHADSVAPVAGQPIVSIGDRIMEAPPAPCATGARSGVQQV
jgi:hypothetical protein